MSCDEDELENNTFFRALQTNFLDLHEKAQENCYMICVPKASSIFGVSITRRFVETQILRPSPYFKGQYVTLHNGGNKTVLLDEIGQHLETGDGFSQQVKVKILSEELAYNKDYKPYKILITNGPLDTRFQSKRSDHEHHPSFSNSPKISFLECKQFLHSFPEYLEVLRELDESIKLFNNNYMVLKDYLDDATNRLEKIINNASEKCLKCTKMKYYSDSKFRDILSGAVESYVMGNVYNRVFPVINERFQEEDKFIFYKCLTLDGVLPEQLGVRKEFSCYLPATVAELSKINSLHTPYEKLVCVKTALDNLIEEVSSFFKKNLPPLLPGQPDSPCLTSDDLIPILVSVIAVVKCPHLSSDLFYMERFSWFSLVNDIDHLSYSLVTYKAAVEYMRSTDFDFVQTQNTDVKKQVNKDETIPAVVPLLVDGSNSRTVTSKKQKPTARLDRQLDRISHMLDETCRDWTRQDNALRQPRSIFQTNTTAYPQKPQIIPTQDQKKEKHELGEFLSALQDDDFDTPFGKLT